MAEIKYSVSRAVHEQAANFLEDAKRGGYIDNAIMYLTRLASRGEYKEFNLSRSHIAAALKKSARYFFSTSIIFF